MKIEVKACGGAIGTPSSTGTFTRRTDSGQWRTIWGSIAAISFDYIVSMSSPQAGLDAYREATVPKDSPKWKEKYILGDMNTSLIKTVNGLTIMVQHDVVNPQPYDRINLIKGVKGMFRGYPDRIFLDGQKGEEEYTGLDSYREKYEHKLWKEHGKDAEDKGHGGMDYLMLLRLVQCMREGLEPDIDVYDAASWTRSSN